MSSGNICHRGKYVGPTISLGIVTGEGIPVEHSPANIPQRQVAGESPKMSLGNVINVVVLIVAGDESVGADFEVVKILTELLDELNIGEYETFEQIKKELIDEKGLDTETVEKIGWSMEGDKHYEDLGVSTKASNVELTRAYRKTMFVVHPDKCLEFPKAAIEVTKRVGDAYRVLSDDVARRNYD
nr:histidine--tRNA ligase, cytoplasmic [Tanacetum cinerariifolium]